MVIPDDDNKAYIKYINNTTIFDTSDITKRFVKSCDTFFLSFLNLLISLIPKLYTPNEANAKNT